MSTGSRPGQIIGLHWYALRTRSRHEKLVRDQLAQQGIEPLLPTVKRLSQWKDRKKEVEVPLFSGYCFVRFASDQKLPVLKTVGVVDIVGGGQRPEPIPDEEITAIQTLIASVLPYDPHPYLQEGMCWWKSHSRYPGVNWPLFRIFTRRGMGWDFPCS